MATSKINNAVGKATRWFGMHFYPGVAEYRDPEGKASRVYLNENTLRSMDASFEGRPIFVEHVDEVNGKPVSENRAEEMRGEVDGWVVRSFYNAADGKHWVEFVTVSERAEQAIKQGMRLSNAYVPGGYGIGGMWNGVEYEREVTSGEFDHLAIVKHPRYEESVVMTPEQFKKYNEDHAAKLSRLDNSTDPKGDKKMKVLKFFKTTKVDNAFDPELSVILPKSGKETTVLAILNAADEMEEMKKKNEVMADMGHQVKMHDGTMCNVGELLEKHKAMSEKMAEMENAAAATATATPAAAEKPAEAPAADESVANEEEEEKAKKAEDEKMAKNAADKAAADAEAATKAAAKEKADRLRNAHTKGAESVKNSAPAFEMASDQVERGKAMFGSN